MIVELMNCSNGVFNWVVIVLLVVGFVEWVLEIGFGNVVFVGDLLYVVGSCYLGIEVFSDMVEVV